MFLRGQRTIDEKMEYIILKQVLRSGISIGANVKEGLEAQNRRDFLNKINIAGDFVASYEK